MYRICSTSSRMAPVTDTGPAACRTPRSTNAGVAKTSWVQSKLGSLSAEVSTAGGGPAMDYLLYEQHAVPL